MSAQASRGILESSYPCGMGRGWGEGVPAVQGQGVSQGGYARAEAGSSLLSGREGCKHPRQGLLGGRQQHMLLS